MTKKTKIDKLDYYIIERYGDLDKKSRINIKKAMLSYGNNYWWESKDSRELAMYQVFEKILLTDFSTFHEGLEKLLDRPVWSHELGLNMDGIRNEARLAIERIKEGLGGISEENRETKILQSIKMLEDYCKKTGKQFFKVELTKEDSDRNSDGIDTSGYDGYLN